MKDRKAALGHRRRTQEAESELDKSFKAYLTTAEYANDSEQDFHNVEFKEFDGRQDCVNQAREAVALEEATMRSVRDLYMKCLRKVRKDVKQAEVNVADKKRKVDRKDVPKLWMAFVKAGFEGLRPKKSRSN